MAKAYKDDITTRDDSGPITSPEMQFNITKDEKRGWERPRRKQKTDDLSRDTRDTTSNTRDTRVDPGSLRGFDSTQEGSVPPAAPFPPTDDTSAKKGKARRTTVETEMPTRFNDTTEGPRSKADAEERFIRSCQPRKPRGYATQTIVSDNTKPHVRAAHRRHGTSATPTIHTKNTTKTARSSAPGKDSHTKDSEVKGKRSNDGQKQTMLDGLPAPHVAKNPPLDTVTGASKRRGKDTLPSRQKIRSENESKSASRATSGWYSRLFSSKRVSTTTRSSTREPRSPVHGRDDTHKEATSQPTKHKKHSKPGPEITEEDIGRVYPPTAKTPDTTSKRKSTGIKTQSDAQSDVDYGKQARSHRHKHKKTHNSKSTSTPTGHGKSSWSEDDRKKPRT